MSYLIAPLSQAGQVFSWPGCVWGMYLRLMMAAVKYLGGRLLEPLGQPPPPGRHFVAVNLSRPGLRRPAEII